MSEFLPKDPTKALVEVKEKLYGRLKSVNDLLDQKEYGDSSWDQTARFFLTLEKEFLEKLLDTIEKS